MNTLQVRNVIATVRRQIRQRFVKIGGKYDVVVVSYGGSGTTVLARHLGQFLRVNSSNSETDGILHASSPSHPIFADIDVRCAIYVFAHPAESALSVFGRNFQARMVTKLQSRHSNQKEYVDAIRKQVGELSFDEFLGAGRDSLGLYDHLKNWTNPNPVPFPILNVKYDALFESADAIAEFVGTRELNRGFPERRPRASRLDSLPSSQAAALRHIYRDASELYEKLPNVARHETKL